MNGHWFIMKWTLHCMRQFKNIYISSRVCEAQTDPINIPNIQLKKSFFSTSEYSTTTLPSLHLHCLELLLCDNLVCYMVILSQMGWPGSLNVWFKMSIKKAYLDDKHLMTQKSFHWNLKIRYYWRQTKYIMLEQRINTKDYPT